MTPEAKNLRDGIFTLFTRRFGTVAELIIERRYLLGPPLDQHHDATDQEGRRVEIKFSRLLRENKNRIKGSNLVQEALKATITQRALTFDDIRENGFDCNIQQVKTDEFDILYYGIFFADKIAVFKMTSEEVRACPGYSDFQHKGNEGEGQFHIHNDSIDYHLENHFQEWITYDQVLEMFS